MDYKIFKSAFVVPKSYENRSYQYLQLRNGVLALVITDPSENTTSCSLTVNAGHHSDPREINGLAHLCEHMLCVRSKKYPVYDYYRTTIQQAGGQYNAMTNSESTSYYFSMPLTSANDQNIFDKVLDIFSSNFKKPLFNTHDISKEIHAIHNEHDNNKSASNRVSFYGYKLLANKDHAFSRFSTGNFDTLTASSKKYDMQKKLQQFFNTHYTGDKMTLVVRGPSSINILRKAVILYFSDIGACRGLLKQEANTEKSTIFSKCLADFNISENAWKDSSREPVYKDSNSGKGILINMKLGNNAEARIGFPISIFKSNMALKDVNFLMDYWCEILGDESINSLASNLKANHYITDLITTISSITSDVQILELKLNLTEKGVSSFDIILNSVFTFFEMFYKPDSKLSKHLAKSMSQFHGITLYNFLNAEPPTDSAMETKNISSLMLGNFESFGQWFNLGYTAYDLSDTEFEGAYSETQNSKSFWLSKAKLFSSFMEMFMKVSNTLITFVGDTEHLKNNTIFDKSSKIVEVDPYFQFKYYVFDIDASLIKCKNDLLWNHRLPQPNNFAPKSVNEQAKMIKLLSESTHFNSSLNYTLQNTGTLSKPKLIHYDDGCQMWIKQETDSIFSNKGLMTISLSPSLVEPSLELVTSLDIFITAINNRLESRLYPAIIIGYSYSILPSTKGDCGVIIHVSGPNDDIMQVLAIIVKEMKLLGSDFAGALSSSEFQNYKQKSIIGINQICSMPSSVLATFGLYAALEENTWSLKERRNALEEINISTIAANINKIFEVSYLTSFLHGDVSLTEHHNKAINIMKKLVINFKLGSSKVPSTVWLPENSNFKICSKSEDTLNAVVYFIQTNRRDDLKARTIAKFVSYIMTATLTSKLRSEYQLGYIVLIGMRSMRRSQGIHITIVNNLYDSATLDQKIDGVLMCWYEQFILKMKSNDFKLLVSNFVALETSQNRLVSNVSGSVSLSQDSFNIAGGGRLIVELHKGYWEQISTNLYEFSTNGSGEERIDTDFLKTITLQKVCKYIKHKILPISPNRSKMAILLDSDQASKSIDSTNKLIPLYSWLTSMGLLIGIEALADIVKQSGDSQISFAKNLFKYHRNNGTSIAVITRILTKMSKSFMFSINDSNVIMNEKKAEGVKPDDIFCWQEQVGFVQHDISLSNKLANMKVL